MSPILIALLKAIADSSLRIGTVIKVRGFGLVVLSILLLMLGRDWVAPIIQLVSLWRIDEPHGGTHRRRPDPFRLKAS